MATKPRLHIDISRIEELAAQGLSQAEICLCLGISESTLYNRKRECEEFEDAIKRGKAKAASEIANRLYQMAKGGDLGAIIWYEKTRRGLSDKIQQNVTFDVSKLSDDELRAIAEG